MGGNNTNGYGRAHDSQGKLAPAHRVAWEMKNGPFPKGKLALHSCDTPLCVNPDHIRPGTHAENMKDREERDRTYRPLAGGVCSKGHALSGHNLLIDGNQKRCRQCRNEYWKERKRERKAMLAARSTKEEK